MTENSEISLFALIFPPTSSSKVLFKLSAVKYRLYFSLKTVSIMKSPPCGGKFHWPDDVILRESGNATPCPVNGLSDGGFLSSVFLKS